MLLKRIATAVVGIPVVICLILYGQLPFLMLIWGLAFFGLLEFYDLMKHKGIEGSKLLFVSNGLIFVVLSSINNQHTLIFHFFLFYVFLSTLMLQLFKNEIKNALSNAAVSFLGIMYVSWLTAHFVYLRQLPGGFFYLLLVFFVIWANDSGAYFIGLNYGKRKLCPKISPNKTWEGAIGGLICALIVVLLAGLCTNYFIPTHHFTVIQLLVLGLLISIFGQIGDLIESLFKRDAGIKDSGNLIPGHGGMLDRFDSLLFAVPVVYYYLKLILLIG